MKAQNGLIHIMEIGGMQLRYILLVGICITLSGCAANKPGVTANIPDSGLATIKTMEFKSRALFDDQWFLLRYLDGGTSSSSLPEKILPGVHTLGFQVDWGFCVVLPFPGCTHRCYAGIVLQAEAGRSYDYVLQKKNDQEYLNVSDNSGNIVSTGLCEKCSWGYCGEKQINATNARIEEEANRLKNIIK